MKKPEEPEQDQTIATSDSYNLGSKVSLIWSVTTLNYLDFIEGGFDFKKVNLIEMLLGGEFLLV